jgi:hypothetical protein
MHARPSENVIEAKSKSIAQWPQRDSRNSKRGVEIGGNESPQSDHRLRINNSLSPCQADVPNAGSRRDSGEIEAIAV